MSPLTKLFVVLLVLVSIIQTAGIVTFVNKLEPLQKELEVARTNANVQSALASQKATNLQEMQDKLVMAQKALDDQKRDFNTQVQQLRSTIEKADGDLAALRRDNAVLVSSNASQSTALQVSESSKEKLSEQVLALRKDADERLRQVADLNGRVNTLTAENAVLIRDLRHVTEQLTDARGKNEQLGKMLTEMGVSAAMIAKADPGPARISAPAINGIIRSRRTIAGKDYATISIGSADQVTKGMEFKILDKESGAFLGIMTIDVLDANEAMGQIVADPNNLAQIKAGNLVKTQI